MSRLVNALQSLGLQATVELGGRWVMLHGERCRVYVVQGPRSDGFYTWCDAADARSVKFFRDPIEAIQAGLHRAAQPEPGNDHAGLASDRHKH